MEARASYIIILVEKFPKAKKKLEITEIKVRK
jgi:hypothetical protein